MDYISVTFMASLPGEAPPPLFGGPGATLGVSTLASTSDLDCAWNRGCAGVRGILSGASLISEWLPRLAALYWVWFVRWGNAMTALDYIVLAFLIAALVLAVVIGWQGSKGAQ
jgi:hypothetical protein